ncbi:succinate dehydrogenase subunit 5, mitochondrial-like isoform X2 [Phoenix dactylifera]|uniref:Succinate dehydrogenase subunit 5, mitochondrial-like isoform X2 n=1 Tax=Phoenix dactylifera TaxID=42345 RepID=A0A8B7CIK4_PHODC|nr:succinate dehydrogenase subunit 5, mitochondrial-like isoform X2 [Phoenix dactylifera]
MASTTTILRSLSSAAGRRLLCLSRASFSSLSTGAGARSSSTTTTSIFRPSSAVNLISDCSFPFTLNIRRVFCSSVSQLPAITDPDRESAFKDLMAMNWEEIPDSVVNETKKALSKATDDKDGQEALVNVFRAAEASVEFGGVLVTLRMALDDLNGLSGENVGRLPDYIEDAIRAAYKRYMAYLDSFGPGEAYLRKKVETELGTKMIHLKMRCSGIGSEWGKVTLLGTSGLSGSYVELRS